MLRRRYALRLRNAKSQLDGGAHRAVSEAGEPSADADTLRAAIAAERQRLSELRANGTIGDDAFQQVEEELDWAELDAESVLRAEHSAV